MTIKSARLFRLECDSCGHPATRRFYQTADDALHAAIDDGGFTCFPRPVNWPGRGRPVQHLCGVCARQWEEDTQAHHDRSE